MRVAAYCRYSSDNQRTESIDAQLRAINEYCKKNDYVLVKTYIDEARSATSDDRPRFLDMIADASSGDWQMVIVHKLDRFARNRFDSAFYKRKLRDVGVSVGSVVENIDDSPESIILESVLEGMAEYYSVNLAREVKKGLKENALKAIHNGGTPPLGYDVNPDLTYRINEKEAEAIRLMFKWFLDGFGYQMIARKLNDEGYLTKVGKPFVKNSIRDLILNEKFTGVYVYAKGTPDEIRVDDGLPAIIPREIFEAARNKIESRVRGPRMDVKNVYYLSGLMKCGVCGASYCGDGYASGRSKVYYVYGCTNYKKGDRCTNTRIRKDYLESEVIENIKNIFFTDEAIQKIADDMSVHLKSFEQKKKTEIDYLEKAKIKTQSKIDKMFELFYDDVMDRQVLAAQVEKLKAELNDYEERLATMKISYNGVSRQSIVEFLKRNRANLEKTDDTIIRKVIETFVSEIIVHRDRIDVVFKISPSGPSGGPSGNAYKKICGKVGGDGEHLTYPQNICAMVGGGEPLLTYPRTIKRPASNRW